MVNTRGARIFPCSTKGAHRPNWQVGSCASTACPRFSLVLTSPLRRAAETCSLAGFEGEIEPDLMEWDYGDYEGLTTAEIRQRQPGWSLWEDGVPGGESVSDVGRRADRVLERVRAGDGDALCVAHGHLLRVLAARWLGLPPVAGRLFLLRPGGISVLGMGLRMAGRRGVEPGPGLRP